MAGNKRSGKKKPGRGAMLDDALAQVLATAAPDKDTGPDPDDILSGVLGEPGPAVGAADPGFMAGSKRNATAGAGTVRMFEIGLDADERARVERICRIVREATGVRIDTAQAVRIALKTCGLQRAEIEAAYVELFA